MSRYIVDRDDKKFVFGWDPPLGTYFLQVHDKNRPEDDTMVFWVGAERASTMKEVDDLVFAALENGLQIHRRIQIKLYRDKEDGR